jgi:hypothetical protein
MSVVLAGLSAVTASCRAQPPAEPVVQPAAGEADTPSPERLFPYASFRAAWATSGRAWLEEYGLAAFDEPAGRWVPRPDVDRQDTAQALYTAEMTTVVAVHAAMVCGDRELEEEVASYFRAMLTHLVEVDELRAHAGDKASGLLTAAGDPGRRTFAWTEVTPTEARLRECSLCSSQAMFPLAMLLRHVARTSHAARGVEVRALVQEAWRFLVHEHVNAWLFDIPHLDSAQQFEHPLAEAWAALAEHRPEQPRFGLLDRDLWLLATVGEVLAAHRADPSAFPLESRDVMRLAAALADGSQALADGMVRIDSTRDWQRRIVGSILPLADGLAAHPSYRFARLRQATMPADSEATVTSGVGWDISHASRIPIALRSLHETRREASAFPNEAVLRGVLRQYLYVAVDHPTRPTFRNFLSGHDGWFMADGGVAHPPSSVCGASADRPCLTPGAVQGWGFLAPYSSDYGVLLRGWLDLARAASLDAQTLRNRYYAYLGESFAWPRPDPAPRSVLWLWILGSAPQQLEGCGAAPSRR